MILKSMFFIQEASEKKAEYLKITGSEGLFTLVLILSIDFIKRNF